MILRLNNDYIFNSNVIGNILVVFLKDNIVVCFFSLHKSPPKNLKQLLNW